LIILGREELELNLKNIAAIRGGGRGDHQGLRAGSFFLVETGRRSEIERRPKGVVETPKLHPLSVLENEVWSSKWVLALLSIKTEYSFFLMKPTF